MTNEPELTRDQIEEAAATWIARRDREGWTPADAASLEAWLAESVGHRVAYFRLNAAWHEAARVGSSRSAGRQRLFAIAASVLVLLVGAVVSLKAGWLAPAPDASSPSSQPPAIAQSNVAPAADAPLAVAEVPIEPVSAPATRAPFQQRYTTAIGASRSIALPDGSRVMLDTGSQIRVSMEGRSRIVELDRGQAFFEVAHDEKRPFVVNTDRLSVVAVGTAFSVRREAAEIRVVVSEGTVRLEDKGLLPAGGIARIEGDVVQMHQGEPTEVDRNLSWRRGVLTFRHTPLSEAAAEFNRYDTRHIVIRDPAIAAIQLGGVFRSNDAEVFARLLERTFPIDATLHPDRIELTARSSP